MVSSIRFNIFSNFLAQIWTGLIQLIFVPTYINLLGADSYGLISLYPSLLSIFTALDLGLGTTLSRELAKYSASSEDQNKGANLTYTLEIIFWVIGLGLGLIFASSADWIATNWLNKTQLPQHKVYIVFILMGILTFFRWPISLYNGGMIGVQRQMSLNTITIFMETLRAVGAIFILKFVKNDIYIFFLWQIIVTALNTFFLRKSLWQTLSPSKYTPIFSKKLLSEIARFSAGVSGITLLMTISMQTDKIILSKVLSLDMLGYYTLSFSIALVLTRVINPIVTAFYPRFVQAVYNQDYALQRNLYHQSSQLMAVFIIPISLTLSIFSEDILKIWFNNPTSTALCAPLVSILVLGTMFNGLVAVPYHFQLANAWTKLALWKNIISFMISIPLLIFLSDKYGARGASFVWMGLNLSYIFIEQNIFHHRFLQTEKISWYFKDVLVPLVSALSVILLGKFWIVYYSDLPQIYSLIIIGFISLLSLITTAFVTDFTRSFIIQQWHVFKNKNFIS